MASATNRIARADDLVDLRQALDAVRQRRHGLRPAQAIDLGDAQLVAGGQQVPVVRAELRRRRDHRQFLDARRLRRHGRHQHRRRIRRRAARHADADARKRQISLPQVSAVRPLELHVAVQDGLLKLQNVVANAADRGQKVVARRAMGRRQFVGRHAQRLRPSARPCRCARE